MAFGRYTLIGGVATAVHYGVLLALVEAAHVAPAWAAAAGAVAGAAVAYLGNRPRKVGVMEKCHFCIQRTRAGKYPACLEVCPVGARKFGNILDPESEVSHILREKRVFIQLKEELGTSPRFYYYFDK